MSRVQDDSLDSLGSENILKVTLQYTPEIDAASIRKRRKELIKAFRLVEDEIEPDAMQVDLTSLSPLAQTVMADIPETKYSKTVKKLKKLNVRVDPIVERKMV